MCGISELYQLQIINGKSVFERTVLMCKLEVFLQISVNSCVIQLVLFPLDINIIFCISEFFLDHCQIPIRSNNPHMMIKPPNNLIIGHGNTLQIRQTPQNLPLPLGGPLHLNLTEIKQHSRIRLNFYIFIKLKYILIHKIIIPNCIYRT